MLVFFVLVILSVDRFGWGLFGSRPFFMLIVLDVDLLSC